MVCMSAVVVRAQHRTKAFAGGASHNAQELPLGRRSTVPICAQADPASIGEDKSRHINRLCARMSRPPVSAGHIAAGIASHCLNLGKPAAQYLASSTINAKACPVTESVSDIAFYGTNIADCKRTRIAADRHQLNCAKPVASRRGIAIG